MTEVDPARVIAWYEAKTRAILEKYGPGPRVSFHTGLAARDEPIAADAAGVREQLRRAQARMMDRALHAWDAPRTLAGRRVIDVGCGLGGPAQVVAGTLGAQVIAVTPVTAHLSWVRRFAEQAGLSERITAVLGDAHALEAHGAADAAFSLGATTYFDRDRYFASLARTVRSGGAVLMEDTFLGRAGGADAFDAYWGARIGTLAEYRDAAGRHGFRLVRAEDVSAEAAGFWRLAAAHSERLLEERAVGDDARADRRRSIAWQEMLGAGYADGGYQDLLLAFHREG
jgi:tocopherol O-methyltransferase